MSRYFFHVDGLARDTKGKKFSTLAEAKCEAVKMSGELICEGAGGFWDTDGFMMTVTDEAGLTLFRLMFVGTEAAASGVSHLRL